MQNCEFWAAELGSVPLFQTTRPEALAKVLHLPDCRMADFAVGEDLCSGSERVLGVLWSGGAEILSADSEKPVPLRRLRTGSVFGAAALFSTEAAPMSHIRATAPTRVLLMGARAIRTLMEKDTHFLECYLAFLCDRVSFLNKKIRCFTAGSAERRLALWLALDEGDSTLLPASLSALADMLALGRASLYRALDKLEREGLIVRNTREIRVISKEKLLDFYHKCDDRKDES